jgi:hypothetical protein
LAAGMICRLVPRQIDTSCTRKGTSTQDTHTQRPTRPGTAQNMGLKLPAHVRASTTQARQLLGLHVCMRMHMRAAPLLRRAALLP